MPALQLSPMAERAEPFIVSIRLTALRYGRMKTPNTKAATIGAAALYIRIPYTLQATTVILFPTVC